MCCQPYVLFRDGLSEESQDLGIKEQTIHSHMMKHCTTTRSDRLKKQKPRVKHPSEFHFKTAVISVRSSWRVTGCC